MAQALLHDPQVLILDEPTDGLDPNQKHEMRTIIAAMRPEKAIIISTHLLEEVEAVCSRAIIIAQGRILADATPGELAARSRYHNAVRLVVAGGDAAQIRAELLAAAGGAAVEAVNDGEGEALLVFPRERRGHRRRRRRSRPRPSLAGRRCCGSSAAGSTTSSATSPWHPPRPRPLCRLRAWTSPMRNILIIFRRELASYFATPLAYVFIVIFLVLAGVLTFFVGNFFERGQADLQPFFAFHPWLYLVLIPALSMRLWAEERKSGTIELFLTLPIRMAEAVVGKFLAAWCFAGIALALTFPFWITVNFLGTSRQRRHPGELYRQLADGRGIPRDRRRVSAVTKNQVIAFVVTAALGFVFTVGGSPVVLGAVPGLGAARADRTPSPRRAFSAISPPSPAASSICATSSISCRS